MSAKKDRKWHAGPTSNVVKTRHHILTDPRARIDEKGRILLDAGTSEGQAKMSAPRPEATRPTPRGGEGFEKASVPRLMMARTRESLRRKRSM